MQLGIVEKGQELAASFVLTGSHNTCLHAHAHTWGLAGAVSLRRHDKQATVQE